MKEQSLPTARDRIMAKREAEAERKKSNSVSRAARKDQQRMDVDKKVNENITSTPISEVAKLMRSSLAIGGERAMQKVYNQWLTNESPNQYDIVKLDRMINQESFDYKKSKLQEHAIRMTKATGVPHRAVGDVIYVRESIGDNKYSYRPYDGISFAEIIDEEMNEVEKRKYINLKKRAKAGNAQAKKRLAAFEKQHADELKMSKSSATKMKASSGVKDTKDVGGADDHIIMQLRKAQDVGGNMDIKILPSGKKVKVTKKLIDMALKKYDSLQKPADKKKFRNELARALRSKAK